MSLFWRPNATGRFYDHMVNIITVKLSITSYVDPDRIQIM